MTIEGRTSLCEEGVCDLFLLPVLNRSDEITAVVYAMKPRSRGRVTLTSTDPRAPLHVEQGFLSDDADVAVLTEGFERLREPTESEPTRRYAGRELRPGGDVGPEQHVRATASGFFHPTGTCAIGSVVHADDPAREHEPQHGCDCRADRGTALVQEMATATKPDRLHFTGNDDADALIAQDPMALLIGFALDQQVPVQTAFSGPLKLKQRLGTLDPERLAKTDPADLEAAFREKPAIHRFPGAMAQRVQDLATHVAEEYGGHAERLWTEAGDGADLRRRIAALPGYGDMKVKAFSAVLAKRFGVASAQEIAPSHPTLGDVDSAEALAEYQAKKRAYKSARRQAEAERKA